MSSEWIDAYNQWVTKRYKDAGSQPPNPMRSGPLQNGEKSCGCYHYRGKFIRLSSCPVHRS